MDIGLGPESKIDGVLADGFEATRRIRLKRKKLPIISFSSYEEGTLIERGMDIIQIYLRKIRRKNSKEQQSAVSISVATPEKMVAFATVATHHQI